MDKGPFRAQRSADRPAAVRPEPVAPVVAAAPLSEPPHAARTHTPAVQSPKHKKRWPWVTAVIIIVLIVVVAVAYFMMPNQSMGVDSSKYQAVSTTDGQVYFGKLTVLSNGYVRLTGAYYLQTQTDTSGTSDSTSQTSSTDKNSVKLVKLSNKIYGPENEIFIARDQILSYENLAPNGQVAKWLQRNN